MNSSIPAWYCVRTMHKHEHLAHANLLQMESVDSFFPKLRARRRVRGKLITTVEPLFPCYIFAKFDLGHRLDRVKYTFGVRNVVSFNADWPTIPESEIMDLRSRFGHDETLDRPVPDLEPGTEVDVLNGPFKGFKAVVSYSMPATERVRILIELLSRSTVVELGIRDVTLPDPYPVEILAESPVLAA